MSRENTDRLSTVPEEITSHIISIMPTKFAVRTSILSRKWRYNWTTVTNLDFEDLGDSESDDDEDQPDESFDNFSKFVGGPGIGILQITPYSVIPITLSKSCASKPNLLNWIDKLVRLSVCALDIHAPIVELPLNLLTCKTLTKLRLDIFKPDYSLWEPSCQPVNLPCVKILDIVVLSNPFFNAFKLIYGCPILESLSLEVRWRPDEEDYIFNLPTLKRLELREVYSSVMNKVILRAPNLECLFVSGFLRSSFVMVDISSLIEASILLYYIGKDHLSVELIKALNGVESLSVEYSNVLFEEGPVTCCLPIFPKMKHLDLRGFYLRKPVSRFLECSPELQHFCLQTPSLLFFSKVDESFWIKPKSVPACMLTELATFKFLDYDGKISDTEFLEYMLGNAQVLKTITITWRDDMCMEEQTLLAARLLNFAKPSAHCEVQFSLKLFFFY